MTKNRLFFFIIFFLSFFNGLAQEERKALTLKLILAQISQQHNVQFNYIEDEIVLFKLLPPEKKWKLQEKLDYIKKETQLLFKIISKKYITVYNDKKLDKPLCGYLIDSTTNVPIENALISIVNTNEYTFSDINGRFELPKVSSNTIQFKHISYLVMEINPIILYTSDCPTFKLNPVPQALNEVITKHFLTSGITKKNDGTFEIKPKKFGLLPGLTEPDVFETIKQIPGITSVDETVSNINVRGGTHDQNLFLWNGIRLFQTSHFFGLISALNPNLAQTIKVSKNGSSPFYGESVSSVIDISTHTDNLEGNKGSIGLNMINIDFYGKIKTSKSSNLEFSGRRSYNDVLKTPTYKSYANRIFQNTIVTNLSNNQIVNFTNDEKFYFYDFTLQFHQKINKKSDLNVDAIVISNYFELTQSKLDNTTIIVRDSQLKQQSKGGNILFNTKWNEKNTTEISAYASYYSIISENESIQNSQIFNQENTILDSGFRLKNSHQLTKTVSFHNGYQLNEIGITNFDQVNSPAILRKIKEVLRTHAIITEFQYQSKNNKLTTRFGARGNYIEQLNTFLLEPRLQSNYAINSSLNVEVLAEIKSQSSAQIIDLQQDFLGIEKRRWVLSNDEDIPIIKSNQVAIGLNYKENNWLVTLDNFYKKVTGISSRSQGFQNQLEFLKINGAYSIFGSEFLIQKQYSKITTWLSYTYSKNNYTFNNFSPTTFPNNFDSNHNIGMAVVYDYNKLKIALGSRWFSGKPNTEPLSNIPVINTQGTPEVSYNRPNSSNLDNYFQVNFSSSYAFSMSKKTRFIFGFSIQNLLDSNNTINQSYSVNQNATSIEQLNTFSLERSLNAFMRIQF